MLYSDPCLCLNSLIFCFNQPVYKQLALGQQITKELSELNPPSQSNNKNYRLKISGVFPRNKRKIAVEPTIHQNSAVSNSL